MISVGDIAELKTTNGLGYVQLVDKHPRTGGEMVRVFRRIFSGRPASAEVLEDTSSYFAFVPFSELVRRKLIQIVFNAAKMNEQIPPTRWPGARSRDGRVLNWVIKYRDGLDEPVTELSAEQEKLPIGSIWGLPLLVERIEQDWTPDKAEYFRQEAIRNRDLERTQESVAKKPRSRFFLYFPTAQSAKAAAAKVRESGFDVDIDKSCLPARLLATSNADPTPEFMERYDSYFQDLANQFGAEYDGHEIALK